MSQEAASELFAKLLSLAVESGASDIHVKTGKPALFRLHGDLQPVDMDAVPQEYIEHFVQGACPLSFFERWQKDSQVDFAYSAEGVGRFRVNAFIQRGTPSIVFRHVKDHPPTFADLNHEAATFEKLCAHRDGIVLVCGPTGSGKSSTLAAMLDHINHTIDKHIVTLEDPIEFTYTDDHSVFNQREVGIDVASFTQGMKSVLRQDPDIILIGEMRDRDTFETALSAAETGHLVFGTLHSSSAQQSVQRLFEFFPPEQQPGMRRQIAGCLRATITQRLIPAMDGGRVPACEIFVIDAVARKVISEGAFDKIGNVLEAGKESGSKSFNQDLYRLVKAGTVAKSEALAASPNAKALEMNLKGIFLSSGGIVS